jgi:TPP-dependent pyruvate/acetoin dehydrogenase alpha subunit
MTYRMKGHAEHDAQAYVPKEELEEWRRRDPLERYARELVATAAATTEDLGAIDRAVSDEIDREVEAAEQSPLPTPEDALKNVYAAGIPVGEAAPVRRNS